jgi:hypothetical protein
LEVDFSDQEYASPENLHFTNCIPRFRFEVVRDRQLGTFSFVAVVRNLSIAWRRSTILTLQLLDSATLVDLQINFDSCDRKLSFAKNEVLLVRDVTQFTRLE